MPSPFPGMDPYLEKPGTWPDLHQVLITYLRTTLNKLVAPRYLARIQERVYVVQTERDIYPDVTLKERPLTRRPKARGQSSGGAALASDPPGELTREPYEVQEGFIEIRPADEPGRLVAVVEVLSPSTKRAGSDGRQAYRAKQREVLASPAHLLELDFLRQGEHTVAAPPPDRLLRQGPYDYLVCLSRGGERNRCQVWGFTVRQRLPRILVPLAEGDEDRVLDLQAVFDRVFDDGGYAAAINYGAEPAVPLGPSDAAWADALLREQGSRRKRRKPDARNGS